MGSAQRAAGDPAGPGGGVRCDDRAGSRCAAPIASGTARRRSPPAPRLVLAHAVLRKLALCSIVFSAVQVCLTSYVVTFLSSHLSWTLVAAGIGAAVSQAAGIGGRILWGVAADRRRESRAVLLMLTSVMMLCGLALGIMQPGSSTGWVLAVLGRVRRDGDRLEWRLSGNRGPPGTDAADSHGDLGSFFFTYFGVVVGPPMFGAVATAAGHLGAGFMLLALPLTWAGVLLW